MFPYISRLSEPVCIQCLSVFICPVCSLQHWQSITVFQLSGKRSLMSSFGRSQQQDQWCSITLIWQKGTFMSNAWKGPKPTCAIMSWTGLWGRGILVKGLPITGKKQHPSAMNDGFNGKYCLELCQVFQSIATVVPPVLTPVHQRKPQLVQHSVTASMFQTSERF